MSIEDLRFNKILIRDRNTIKFSDLWNFVDNLEFVELLFLAGIIAKIKIGKERQIPDIIKFLDLGDLIAR